LVQLTNAESEWRLCRDSPEPNEDEGSRDEAGSGTGDKRTLTRMYATPVKALASQ
jgi:hypothetical protein